MHAYIIASTNWKRIRCYNCFDYGYFRRRGFLRFILKYLATATEKIRIMCLVVHSHCSLERLTVLMILTDDFAWIAEAFLLHKCFFTFTWMPITFRGYLLLCWFYLHEFDMFRLIRNEILSRHIIKH